MILIIIFFSLILFSIISYIDIKYLKIPNWSIFLVLFIGVIYQIYIGQSFINLFVYTCIFFLVILFGLVLFILNVWGAGDAKLMAASVFLVDLPNVMYFLCGCFICGVVWFLVCWPLKIWRYPDCQSASWKKMQIPFAPGIFSSLIIMKCFF